MLRHDLLGGIVQLYRRGGNAWHCAARIDGYQHRASTKQKDLALAQVIAEDWYLDLRGKARAGLITKRGPTFDDMAALFEAEYVQITDGERSPKWVQSHKDRLRLHLRPFFGKMEISEVNGSAAQNYRVHRAGQFGRLPPKDKDGNYVRAPRPPSRSTIHDEIGTLSLVLKTALRHGKIMGMPDLSPPYRQQKKVYHRPWFTLKEYKELYAATGKAAKAAPEAYRWNYEQLHDQVLFMGNTGLRPDEAGNLQHRDITITMDEDTGEQILEIEVRGKTGYGPCKSMPGAVEPYRRLLARAKPAKHGRKIERERMKRRGETPPDIMLEYPKPQDSVFPSNHTDLFNDILVAEGLKFDRDGMPRVLYSLRHTYICLRLLDGADIYQLAKNCRTSVEMIEKHYAIHLKNVIDASAINVRKPRKRQSESARGPYSSKDGEEAGTGAPSAGA